MFFSRRKTQSLGRHLKHEDLKGVVGDRLACVLSAWRGNVQLLLHAVKISSSELPPQKAKNVDLLRGISFLLRISAYGSDSLLLLWGKSICKGCQREKTSCFTGGRLDGFSGAK